MRAVAASKSPAFIGPCKLNRERSLVKRLMVY